MLLYRSYVIEMNVILVSEPEGVTSEPEDVGIKRIECDYSDGS